MDSNSSSVVGLDGMRMRDEPHVYADMKARTDDPSWGNNLHQWLTEQARQRFTMHVAMIEQAAWLSSSADDFWARLENFYLNRPLQLPLMGMPPLLLVGK